MGDSGLTALLFSGGMDSVALAHYRRPDVLITINYGQIVASSEISAARYFASELKLPLILLDANFRGVGSGSLVNSEPSQGKHPEWWPFRNQLLVSVAAAWSVSNDVRKLMIGTVESDGCFADGTVEFVQTMSNLLAIQEGGITLDAPAIKMSSAELIRVSQMPLRLLPMCFSCNVSLRPCGNCRSCLKFIETMDTLQNQKANRLTTNLQ